MPVNNYTLGRGRVYVARFLPGTQVPDGFRYIGNTPEFSLSIDSEVLDHYSSDRGIREKDDSVPLEVNRTGSLTTDQISPENVAMFFFGVSQAVAQAAVASQTYTLSNIHRGMAYKLGVSPQNPTGYFGINPTGFSMAVGATALVSGVDYTIDFNRGIIEFLDTSSIAVEGATVTVTAAIRASTRQRVISGSSPVECAVRYVSDNPKGDNFTFDLPYCKLTPNGDYSLKGDDWQTIPLSLEVLKPTIGEAIYRDGIPQFT